MFLKKFNGDYSLNIEICDINSIRPSTYNPRETDPDRLGLIELSLRKFGFLLPIYADNSGEILSGHQRHLVAQAMGSKRVPVERVKELELPKRKAINIVFNRGTNDFRMADDTKNVTSQLNTRSLNELLKNIPDVEIDSQEFFPCLNIRKYDIKKLLYANQRNYNPYARNIARTLHAEGIIMPILIKPNFEIINGIGRLHLLAEKKYDFVECLEIPFEKAEAAGLLLNKITMDFDLHNKYQDVLRYNSFRRAVSNRPGLGRGFYVALFGNIPTKDFQLEGNNLKKWKMFYGSRVVDFGAGHLTDTRLLEKAGINVTPFEPYKIKSGTNEIDKDASKELTLKFLEKIAHGFQWDSIFISSVLNSVPFFDDRKKIIQIIAALCNPYTMVFGWTMSNKTKEWENPEREYLSENAARSLKFRLHYEDGIMLGGFNDKPKVQKYHSVDEAISLFKIGFSNVLVKHISDSISIIAKDPIINPVELKQAIEFEFDLPYPDGSRMNLVKEAKEAFVKRLNLQELLDE